MPLLLFDIDGTLTLSGQQIKDEMISTIEKLAGHDNIVLGLVGGGTLEKIRWQMRDAIKYFKYVFAECGAIVCVNQKVVSEKNMLDACDRNLLNNLIRKSLHEISQMPIIYHGNPIDFRKGLIYVSPPGMQATDYERNIFIDRDKKLGLRNNLITQLRALDPDQVFEIAIGGAVGVAIYPKGWDKSQVIEHVKNEYPGQIYYFGDKTEPGGNDYPIYSHKLVQGVSVTDYFDTIKKLQAMF